MSLREEQKLDDMALDLRACIQAAAYTVYAELAGNKKHLSQKEFHKKFVDNWSVFFDLDSEEE